MVDITLSISDAKLALIKSLIAAQNEGIEPTNEQLKDMLKSPFLRLINDKEKRQALNNAQYTTSLD